MKHFLFLIGILTVSSQAHADVLEAKVSSRHTHDICAAVSNWALIAHPHDCHKFYVCANHVPEEFTCAKNYFFDKKQKRCILGSCSKIEKCQNLLRSVEEDCRAFETCDDGNYVREYCPKDSYFNEALAICMPVNDTPEHKCSCILPPYTVFKNPEDCKTFYTCVNGRALLQQCEKGQYFNAYLNTCVTDTHGVCLMTSIMSPEEQAILAICERIGLSDDAGANAGRLIFQPDTDDCSKFYMCTNGRVITKYCPRGFFYNRENRFCEADRYGIACKAILEQAKRKKQAEENEASTTKVEAQNHKHQSIYQHEEDKKTPVKLSVPTVIDPNPETKKILEKHREQVLDEEEFNNNSAEVEDPNNVEIKLPLSELKLPIHSYYDKLASKFMGF